MVTEEDVRSVEDISGGEIINEIVVLMVMNHLGGGNC